MSDVDNDRHDVVILGAHLATGLLAAILARHGVRVAVVPTETDGTVPTGETTVPYTAELFFLLAREFDVPGIGTLGMYDDLPAEARAVTGPKHNLGFLYHRAGNAHRPDQALQFTVPGEHAELHLFRPEVDRYALDLAASYGATVLGAVPATRPRVGADGVEVELADGRVIRGAYLVDGGGDRRLLPSGAVAPEGAGLGHRARLLAAHLTGVRPFEQLVRLDRYGKAAGPWSAGTLLHAFDGGWLQLVRFGTPDDAGTARHGVTLSLDPRRFPASDEQPAAEFRRVVEGFPELRRQFADAVELTPWQRFESWPAVAAEAVGPRWLLFDRSIGRHDLLLSRDLTMSLELVHATARGLLAIARTGGDWGGDGMKEVAAFQLRLFDVHDRFVAAGRIATRDFELWNAYLRVWLLWSILSALALKRARLDGEATGDWSVVERFDDVAYWYPVPRGLPEIVDDTLGLIENVERGAAPGPVAAAIFGRLRCEKFVPPLYDFGKPNARYYHFTRARRLRMLLWSKTTAPADFRRLLTADNVTAVRQSGGA